MRQVLLAIAETAFVASPYPVVLSLEMHCSLPQQERARYLVITPCLSLEMHCSLPQQERARYLVITPRLSLEMHCSLPQQEGARYLVITPHLSLEMRCSLPRTFPSYHPLANLLTALTGDPRGDDGVHLH